MNRCSSPEHPHCTVWVTPGEPVCAHGHSQPADAHVDAPARAGAGAGTAAMLGSSFDMLSRVRAAREAMPPPPPPAASAAPQPNPHPHLHPHVHVSGFDPRAAGGRQTIKLELRGMGPDVVPDAVAELTVLLQSDLLPGGAARQQCGRSLRGEWRPLFVEFSSRGREHGQYRIDVELHARAFGAARPARTWVCTLVLLVPRPDASLGEIHQTFLSTHKNVRISADDASIARLRGLDGGGALDIDIRATNASIAELDLARLAGAGASGAPHAGRIDLALPTIAWDEDLIEVDQLYDHLRDPARDPLRARTGPRTARPPAHPFVADSACLVLAEPDAGAQRHLRLFALDECVLGRHEAGAEADLLLQHYGEHGPEPEGLTRRISARHAIIRCARHGFEIEDVSRYGILLDGVWPGKGVPVPLRLGMRIEFTASIKGVATLVVTALLPHGVVLHRVDAGGGAEAFMLLAPGCRPALPVGAHALPRAAALPLLFHRDGGFWHLDPATGTETALAPSTVLERLAGVHGRVRFAGGPRPEDWVARRHAGARAERRRLPPPAVLGA
jgi:hypothetical protein